MNSRYPEQMAVVVGENLKLKMKEKHMTINDLATESGINYNQLHPYLKGNSLPTIPSLHKICKILGCNLDNILPMNYDGTEAASNFLKVQADSAFKTKVRANLLELSDMAKKFGRKTAQLARSFSELSDAQGRDFAKLLQDNAVNLALVVIEAKGSPSESEESLRGKINDACSYAELIVYIITLLEDNNFLNIDIRTELRKEFQFINKKLSDLILILDDKGN